MKDNNPMEAWLLFPPRKVRSADVAEYVRLLTKNVGDFMPKARQCSLGIIYLYQCYVLLFLENHKTG